MENSTGQTFTGTADHATPNRPPVPVELEQPKLESAHDLKHNHKPNFGRFVAGCPRCEARPPQAKKAKAAKVAPKAPEGGVYLTFEQLQALMAGTVSTQIDGLKEFARELRKPDPEEQAKRQADKDRLEKRKAMRMAEIKIEQEGKLHRQAMCESVQHKKENGKSAINLGQEFSDGFYHPFCHRCGKEFPLVRHTPGAA